MLKVKEFVNPFKKKTEKLNGKEVVKIEKNGKTYIKVIKSGNK